MLVALPLAGCFSPDARYVTRHLVDPDQDFAAQLRAEQLVLAVTVATGHVYSTGDGDRPGGVYVGLPGGLREGGKTQVLDSTPDANLDSVGCVLYAGQPGDRDSGWSLAVDGQATRLVAKSPCFLGGPWWDGEFLLEIVDRIDGPKIMAYPVRKHVGADGVSLQRGGYLWFGPRGGWDRTASGTLVAVSLRKRRD